MKKLISLLTLVILLIFMSIIFNRTNEHTLAHTFQEVDNFTPLQKPPDLTPFQLSTTPATMAEYWVGYARWELIDSITTEEDNISDNGFEAGAQIVIDKNNSQTWYLFSREIYDDDDTDPDCIVSNGESKSEKMKIVVRISSDGGTTWSKPTTIIKPDTANNRECWVTDGSVFYNETENTWHYLFQCLRYEEDENGNGSYVWRGCHAKKQGSSPIGLFTRDIDNPSIDEAAVQPNEIWGEICSSGDHCKTIPSGPIKDEGTFDIFEYTGGYYYVSFHGYARPYGFRGIAKTTNFRDWETVNTGSGTDAIFDKYDTAGWRESWLGSQIGGGAASMFREDIGQTKMYYMLVEGADKDLDCTQNQRWDFGLLRQSWNNLSAPWDQYGRDNLIDPNARNPIIYSSDENIHCNAQYARIFADPTTKQIYLHYSRLYDNQASKIHIYKLVPNASILRNGDAWKCTIDDWQIREQAHFAAKRISQKSSDEGCYFEVGCTSCQNSPSVYQDRYIGTGTNRSVTFGGKFAHDASGGSYTILVALWEFENGVPKQSHLKSVQTSSAYPNNPFSWTVNIQNTTNKLRYEVYTNINSATITKLDEMFLEVK